MAAAFEVYQDTKGEWRFRLKARNGEIIADSEGYKTRQGCLKGIASVQLNAGKALIEFVEGNEKSPHKVKEVKTKKQVIKEIKQQEKIYDDPKKPGVIKPEEEKQDESKVFDPSGPPNWIKPGGTGPSWL